MVPLAKAFEGPEATPAAAARPSLSDLFSNFELPASVRIHWRLVNSLSNAADSSRPPAFTAGPKSILMT